MLKLIEPTMEYDQQIQAYRREFLQPGVSMDGGGQLIHCETTKQWLDLVEQYSHQETVPADKVPASLYILIREEDNKMVGIIQIRHYLNDYLRKYGGHIGYSVAPSERRKGNASRMLAMALEKCRQMGLDKVLITCREDNEGSRRTILKNGGVYESTEYEAQQGRYLQRYWIDLAEKKADIEDGHNIEYQSTDERNRDMNSIYHRTSIRHFQDRPVEREKIEEILRAAMQAPSAKNQQPWEFYVVTDKKMIEELSTVSPYASPAQKAPVVIVPVYRKDCLTPAYAQIDMSIAVENMWLATDALGLGGVWLGIAPVEERMQAVERILNIPESLRAFALFPLGYPAEERQQKDRYDESRIHYII